MKKLSLFLILILLVSIFLFGCVEKDNKNDLEVFKIQGSIGDVKSFQVLASNFKFEPSEIKVEVGDLVRIEFYSTQGFHNFVIDNLNVKSQEIETGFVDFIEFKADKKGEFQYYCSVGDHKERGMVGKLIVMG